MKLLLVDTILPRRRKYSPIICRVSTKYIDPSRGVNGVGTFDDPYNAWGTMYWWAPGTRYLQKAQTTYGATITVYGNGPYELGTYDALTGGQIQDNTRHAMVRPPSGQRALALGAMDTYGRNNISADNLDLRANRTATGLTEGIANGPVAAADTPINVQVRRCILDGNYAAQIKGAGILIEDCVAYGFDSCLNLTSTNVRVRRNKCVHIIDPGDPFVGYDAEWDGIINNLPSGANPEDMYYEYNDIDGGRTPKQGIHLMYLPTTAAPRTLGAVIVRGNIIKNTNQGLYCSYSDAMVEDNIFDGIGIMSGIPGYPGREEIAMSFIASDCTIRNNRVVNSPSAAFAVLSGASGTTVVEDNSAELVRYGVTDTTAPSAYNLIVRNNLITRAAIVGPESDSRLVYAKANIAYSAENNRYGWVDGTPIFETGGVVRSFAAYQAAVEPTAQQVAP